jgi:hypothetical protein
VVAEIAGRLGETVGQPMEHVLRSCLIALRLADRLGLDEQQRAETYWVTMLALVCTGSRSSSHSCSATTSRSGRACAGAAG